LIAVVPVLICVQPDRGSDRLVLVSTSYVWPFAPLKVIGNERNSREHGQLSLHGVAQNCPASLIGPMLVRSFAARLRAGLAAAPFLPRVAILALRSAGEEPDILASRWLDVSELIWFRCAPSWFACGAR
jgi:hypothetical protein